MQNPADEGARDLMQVVAWGRGDDPAFTNWLPSGTGADTVYHLTNVNGAAHTTFFSGDYIVQATRIGTNEPGTTRAGAQFWGIGGDNDYGGSDGELRASLWRNNAQSGVINYTITSNSVFGISRIEDPPVYGGMPAFFVWRRPGTVPQNMHTIRAFVTEWGFTQ